jgi:D-alanine-D-alanine ligase
MKPCRITDPAEFGRVGVLMGGAAAEREISIKSGQPVLAGLQSKGIDAVGVDIKDDMITPLQEQSFDRVFNIMHGRGGEDGVLQGVLEALKLPYTGSGVMASALSMDKLRTKQCWQGEDLPTPGWFLLANEQDVEACTNNLVFPMIIKPAQEGSSIGMSKAHDKEQLLVAWKLASNFGCDVLAEAWVNGEEYTVGILNDETLPVIRLETPHEFYDYDAKYFANTTTYHCPCGLNKLEEEKLQVLALKASQIIGINGWGRVDLFIDDRGQAQLIEVNTVPGMTDHSLVPMAAKAAEIDFDELVWRILETSISRN